MPKIRPLPESVASRIAAGEVIERPASVLKELVENSIDAGAAKIHIEIRGAGRSLIRIADDGAGLDPADCRAAFERHTTSKITALEDIERLSTFGFRGEALFSIAAVSKVSLTSTPKKARRGWRVEMRGGKLFKEREAPPVAGTVIEVRELFFNTPARAKFLKSDASERGHLTRVVEEAALANPGVGFTLSVEGKPKLDFPAQKNARRRVGAVLGKEYGEKMLNAETHKGGIAISAFVSPADDLRPSRGLQYVFINRRPVASRTIQQALYRAYEPFRQKNRHPAAVLMVNVPAERLDVNVHPTKREVRFRPESALFDAVVKTLSRALLESKGIPTIDRGPKSEEVWRPIGPGRPRSTVREGPADYLRTRAQTPEFELDSGPLPPPAKPWAAKSLRFLGQIERTYLIFEADGGLLTVDQHAAQERILFERFLREVLSGKPASQQLMLPLTVDLPASGVQKVLAQKKRLARVGFTVVPHGKTGLHVTSVPAIFKGSKEIKDVVHHLLEELISPRAAAKDVRYDATAAIACKASVKAHDPLSSREALALMIDLRRCEDPTCCPHGRPTMLSLGREELARRFKRSGPPPL